MDSGKTFFKHDMPIYNLVLLLNAKSDSNEKKRVTTNYVLQQKYVPPIHGSAGKPAVYT